MKIDYINSSYYSNISTRGSGNISKKRLMNNSKKVKQSVSNELKSIITISAAAMAAANKALASKGITHCEGNGEYIDIFAGYNGGYYRIKKNQSIQDNQAKAYVAYYADLNKATMGGLINYINLTKDVKRQDLIQKGLQIHTYELNTEVGEYINAAVDTLSNYIKRDINQDCLFRINDDIFYYDKYSKKVYSMNLFSENVNKQESIIRECQFITDKKGNAIGYRTKGFDNYHQDIVEKEYIEQQGPSEKLPETVYIENNKLFAEAFRFGNSTPKYQTKLAMPKVVEHLSKILKDENITKEDLQIVQFYNKNNNIIRRISYYDASIGSSFIYNEDGKFLYQLDYNKDDFGNIIACIKA